MTRLVRTPGGVVRFEPSIKAPLPVLASVTFRMPGGEPTTLTHEGKDWPDAVMWGRRKVTALEAAGMTILRMVVTEEREARPL